MLFIGAAILPPKIAKSRDWTNYQIVMLLNIPAVCYVEGVQFLCSSQNLTKYSAVVKIPHCYVCKVYKLNSGVAVARRASSVYEERAVVT